MAQAIYVLTLSLRLTSQALAVELGTLPIYFCALYSIKRDNGGAGSKARAHILCTSALMALSCVSFE